MQTDHPPFKIPTPRRGLCRAAEYAEKPLDFSEDLLNVSGFDTIEGRARIGSRPGLVRSFSQQLTPGPNVIVDGIFSEVDDDTRWITPVGWAIAGGVATASGATSNALPQTNGPLVVGATYTITYSYTRTAGSISAACGTTAGSVNSAASGSVSESIVCAGDTGFKFVTVGFTGTVDNVTAKMTGSPVRMASVIRSLAEAETTTFANEFTSTPSWSLPTVWSNNGLDSEGTPSVDSGTAHVAAGGHLRCAVFAAQSPTPALGAFREVSVRRTDLANGGYVYLCMDMVGPTFPNPFTTPTNRGIAVRIGVLNNVGSTTFSAALWANGVLMGTSDYWQPLVVTPAVTTAIYRLNIDSSNVVGVWVDDKLIGSYAAVGYTPPGAQVGVGLASDLLTTCAIDWFRFAYMDSTAVSPSEAAVFSANGAFWREAPAGTLALVTSGNVKDIASDRRIYAAARLQELYIADYGIHAEYSDGATSAAGTTFTSSQAGNWTTRGISALTGYDVLEIVSGTNVTPGIYRITGVAAGSLTITPSANVVTGVGSAIKYRVLRWPKIYDASAITLAPVTVGSLSDTMDVAGSHTSSQFPAGCRSVTLWQDRLWWCNNALTPHGWWASAAGYPKVYDYGDTGDITASGDYSLGLGLILGTSAAVNGTQSEFAGLIGEPLVTIIPINDDLAIFACKTSFYYMTGNPRLNGILANISREVGIVDVGAWCRTPGGKLIVLTPDGLYEVTMQEAIPLSREILPQELTGLTEDQYDISLAYDMSRRGIMIFASGKAASTTSIRYFYNEKVDANEKFDSYWWETGDRTQDATAVVSYQPGGIGMPALLMGGRDGYVRKFDSVAPTDDGTTFNSYIFYGPLLLGGSEYGEGILHELVCILDVLSGSVTLSIHVGHSPQVAKAATARYTTMMTAGRNYNRYPRLRGGYAYVKITGTAGSRWAVESLTITNQRLGRLTVV